MSEEEVSRPAEAWTLSRGRVSAFALLLFVDFVLVAIMLYTDKNLQTDFGALKNGYFYHWYGLLAEGVVDLIAVVAVLSTVSVGAQRRSISSRKYVVGGGVAWTILAILAMLGIVATYQSVGFTSMGEFAKYLFGVTPYPNVLSYIPWLYDLLLAMYVLTALAGALATRAIPSGH